MDVIAFLGSPRKGGNTETLLSEAIRGTGVDVRVFDLNAMDIKPCQNCGGCEETGICIVPDEMQDVIAAIRVADRIIMASPVFFSGVSAQAKAMIDRCQSIWCEKFLLKKEMMKNTAGVECAGKTVTAWFRTISVPEHRTLAYTRVDAMGEILKHPTAMGDAFEAGRALVE
jgi:multimeric flavodoxin WrbA